MTIDELVNTEISKKLNRIRMRNTSYLYACVQIVLYKMNKDESLEHIIAMLTSDKVEQEIIRDIVKECTSNWDKLSEKEKSKYDSLYEFGYEYFTKKLSFYKKSHPHVKDGYLFNFL